MWSFLSRDVIKREYGLLFIWVGGMIVVGKGLEIIGLKMFRLLFRVGVVVGFLLVTGVLVGLFERNVYFC